MELAKLSRNQLLLGALGGALLVTPYLACSSDSASEAGGEADLASLALGTWQGTAELDGETIPFSLTLERQAQQLTAERLAVAGSITSEHPFFDGAVDGSIGISLQRATLSLRLDDGKVLLGSFDGEGLRHGDIVAVADAGTFGLSRP